ncbi:hypothetical protein [Paraburkholderia lacunae]|nr:hypothetical protein [Paraburkholderia lacunae]
MSMIVHLSATFNGYDMRYPYDILTAVCLFVIVISTTILLALS